MNKPSIVNLFGNCFDELRKIDREHSPIDSQSDKISMLRQEIEILLDDLTRLVKAENQREIINCLGSDSLKSIKISRLVAKFVNQVSLLSGYVRSQYKDCLLGLTDDVGDFVSVNEHKMVELAERDWQEGEYDESEQEGVEDDFKDEEDEDELVL